MAKYVHFVTDVGASQTSKDCVQQNTVMHPSTNIIATRKHTCGPACVLACLVSPTHAYLRTFRTKKVNFLFAGLFRKLNVPGRSRNQILHGPTIVEGVREQVGCKVYISFGCSQTIG